jgi:hypothetical protein
VEVEKIEIEQEDIDRKSRVKKECDGKEQPKVSAKLLLSKPGNRAS